MSFQKNDLLILATIVLLSLAFSSYNLGWLSLVSLLPLFYWLRLQASRKTKPKKIIFLIWLAGVLFSAILMAWILFTQPELWSGINTTPARIAQYLSWFTTSLVLSLGWLAFGWYAARNLQLFAKPSLKLAVLTPLLWMLAEYLRSWAFALWWWGPEATLGSHWNFGALGFGASATPVVHSSKILGLYGLGALVVLVNLGLWWLISKKVQPAAWALAVVVVLVITGRLFSGSVAGGTTVGVLQTKYQNDAFRPDLVNHIKSGDFPAEGLDVLVLPEYVDFIETKQGPERRQFYEQVFTKDRPGLLIYTRTREDPNGTRTDEIVYKDQADQTISTQTKNFLIPTGEFLPAVIDAGFRLFGRNSAIVSYNQARQLAKGTRPEKPVESGGVQFGALACSGVVSPHLYRQLANQSADVLINTSSLNIFASAPFYHAQSKQMARFQAVANGRPFVQAASGSYSYIISHDGKFLSEIKQQGLDFRYAKVNLVRSRTVYSYLGEFMIPLGIGFLLVTSGLRRIREAK